MKDTYRVDKVELIWCEDNERWVYLEYNEQRNIIGMNFMQGDEYEDFKKSWCYSDRGLTDFYMQMLDVFPIEKASVTKLQFINKCMWVFHSAISYNEEHNQ